MNKKLLMLLCGLGLLGTVASVPAQNTVIDFEDSQIAHPGLGFATGSIGGASDFPLLDGLANGDSGNWGIEGSNGPQMLGFWGSWAGFDQGYTGPGDIIFSTITFLMPDTSTPRTVDVSFDLLSSWGDGSYTFYGFNNGVQVAAYTAGITPVTLDGFDEYMGTLNFSGVDEIRFDSTAPGGLDNFSFTAAAVPEPSTLALAGMGGIGAFLLFRRRLA